MTIGEFSDVISHFGEQIIFIGGAIMAIYYGLRRMYKTARNVEVLIEHATRNEQTLKDHLEEEKSNSEKIDGKIDSMDKQLSNLSSNMNEIITEIRPNGGSSLKDIVNQTNRAVNNIHERVVVLENINGITKPKRKPRSSKKAKR